MSGKSTSFIAETRGSNYVARRGGSMPWSRSRRRAAAYDARVEYVTGMMSLRMR
jgi:hypothetical protein